jgi:hypothetical protein
MVKRYGNLSTRSETPPSVEPFESCRRADTPPVNSPESSAYAQPLK